MFENLSERFTGIVKRLRGESRLTEDNIDGTLREVRLALLEADVALPVVTPLISNTPLVNTTCPATCARHAAAAAHSITFEIGGRGTVTFTIVTACLR